MAKSKTKVLYSATTGKKLSKGETTTDALGNVYKQGTTFAPTKTTLSGSSPGDSSNLTAAQIAAGYSTIPGAYDPITGELKTSLSAPSTPTPNLAIGTETPRITSTTQKTTVTPTSKYPAPGQTMGDLFTNSHDGKVFNWRTGVLIYDPTVSEPTAPQVPTPQPSFFLPQGTLLKEGTYNNESVKQLQILLGITADGDFGPQTEAAVMAFQQAQGLKVDGIVGPQTAEALSKMGGTSAPITSSRGLAADELAAKIDAESGETPTIRVVGTSASANAEREAAIAQIKKTLEVGIEKLLPFDALTKLDELRSSQGIVQDETELNTIKNAIRQAKEELNQFKQTSNRELSQGGYLGGISEAERNMNFRLNDLALREQTVIGRLNVKNAYINQAMQAGQQTYTNALNAYEKEYNKNVKAIELFNEELDGQKKDSLSGLTTITNLLKENGIENISPQLSTQLDSLALKAGYPSGLFQSVIAALEPKEKILSPVSVDTATGKDIYFYTQKADGTPTLKTVQHLLGGVVPSPGTQPVTDTSGNILEYGTPEYVIQRLKATAGSKTKPVASEREQLGKFSNVVALTDNLMTSLNKTTNDPILGYLKSLNPYDFDARAVNAQVTALVPSVARALYGEVGVLTDTDIERYLKTLPNIRSTTDQNKFIALMTLGNARRSYEQTLLNLANSNVNVSGFANSYKALTDRLTTLEQQIGVAQTAESEDIFNSVVGENPESSSWIVNLWNDIF